MVVFGRPLEDLTDDECLEAQHLLDRVGDDRGVVDQPVVAREPVPQRRFRQGLQQVQGEDRDVRLIDEGHHAGGHRGLAGNVRYNKPSRVLAGRPDCAKDRCTLGSCHSGRAGSKG